MILDPIYCFFTHPDDTTFYDLIECCLDTFFRACRDDARYCRSEEYFAELAESKAWEYLASGDVYKRQPLYRAYLLRRIGHKGQLFLSAGIVADNYRTAIQRPCDTINKSRFPSAA